MLSPDLVETLLRQALEGGADFAEVYAERSRKRRMTVRSGRLEEANSGLDYGAGIRLFFGTEVVYAYTNELTPEGLREALETLLRAKGALGRVDARGAGGLDFRKALPQGLHAPRVPLSQRDKRFRLERLLEAEAGARLAPEIREVEASLQEWEQEVLIANTEGAWAEETRVRTRLYVLAVAQEGTEVQTGYAAPGKSVGLELFELYPPQEVGAKAARQALTNLRARPAPAGTMPVVVGNAFGGVIFHEALGHLLETTSVAKKASVLADRLGEEVASPAVTYIDDGTLPHAWGSTEVDDEGRPTERTVLIEKGILKSYMVDRLGHLLTGYPMTGSGRRQDYTFAPTSRMRNTFIAPGNKEVEDLIAGVEFGLYAKEMGGGQVKPGSGEYNFAVQEGYLIRKGRLEEPVRGAMLVGKGPETIEKVVAVAGDWENAPGMCGSLSGMVPVEVGQPHVLVSEIVVGGRA
ncbi:TldD/PmbA family protein [Thermus thermamylovorans]|uniref:TldD/PmbA family protein n=1 Tax=Thermus thermamylovorans TaxID=2509362 RepID=A0A4Q9AYJ8_9DEIN|nr:TldD/PmbA family protein [Thermus thermamylovorans]TBH16526.1 TldD/PmbA family protein [Thermus thermamylovorans]